jgi:hypothetical protein
MSSPSLVHSPTTLRLAGAVACGLASLHVISLGLFLLPDGPLRRWAPAPMIRYIDTFWYQGWQLFAPEPNGISARLLVQCAGPHGGLGPWRDPLAAAERDQFRWFVGPGVRYARVLRGVVEDLTTTTMEVARRHCPSRAAAAPRLAGGGRCAQAVRAELATTEPLGRATRLARELCGARSIGAPRLRLAWIYPTPYAEAHRRSDGIPARLEYLELPGAAAGAGTSCPGGAMTAAVPNVPRRAGHPSSR